MARVIRTGDVEEERGHCGKIRKLLYDREDVGFIHLEVDKSREHYHERTSEIYFVLEGKGKIKLDDEVYDISRGDVVEIPPYTRHNAFDEDGLKILVAEIPPSRGKDNHFV